LQRVSATGSSPPASRTRAAAGAPRRRESSLFADALFDFDSATLRPAGRSSVARLSRDFDDVSCDPVDITRYQPNRRVDVSVYRVTPK
jgi:outer membrane protein OmpA-like peptidoglycan-associated protein